MKRRSGRLGKCLMRIVWNWNRRLCAAGMIGRMRMNLRSHRWRQEVPHAVEVRHMHRHQKRKATGCYHAACRSGQIDREVVHVGIFFENLCRGSSAPGEVRLYVPEGSEQPKRAVLSVHRHYRKRTAPVTENGERAINDLIRAVLLTKDQRWRENGGRSSLLFTLIEPPDTS